MKRGACLPSFEEVGGPHAWEAFSISLYPLWCHSLIIPMLQGFADENEYSETQSSRFYLQEYIKNQNQGLPWWSSGKESAFQGRGHGFDP